MPYMKIIKKEKIKARVCVSEIICFALYIHTLFQRFFLTNQHIDVSSFTFVYSVS